jgi:hypothetical protein
MCRAFTLASLLFVSVSLLSAANRSQDSATPASQTQDPAAPQAPPDSTQPAAKKAKKVWTNDNLGDANGTISVVGGARSASRTESKSASNKAADPRLIAGYRQQLANLRAQLAVVDKQLADLKGFSKGELKGTGGLKQNTWLYGTSSVEDQLRSLQAKKNQIQAGIDALLDDARKRGIEPGQLR